MACGLATEPEVLELSYPSALLHAYATKESVSEMIISSLSESSDLPILEFAAGTGILKSVTDSRRNLVLVEHEPDAIDPLTGFSFMKNVQCLHQLPWNVAKPDNSMGAIIMGHNAIYRLRPSSFCFSESHRLLSPDGRLFVVLDDICPLEESSSPRVWRARTGTHAKEETVYGVGPDPVLVTSVQSEPFSALCKYDFVRTIPPVARVTGIMPSLGLDVTSVVPVGPRGDVDSSSRPIVVVEAAVKRADPSVEYEEARDTYDDIADCYDDFVGGAEYRVPAWLVDEIRRKYGAGGGSFPRAILDLGCGNGYLGRRLVEAGAIDAQFFGCDFSRQMVEECKRSGVYEAALTFDLNHGVPIVESQLFDIVLACGFIEFLESCEELLAGVHRVLKAGGSALLTFERRSTADEANQAPECARARRLEARGYSLEEVETLIAASGLSIKSLHTDVGYRSPTTGRNVPYVFVHAQRRG